MREKPSTVIATLLYLKLWRTKENLKRKGKPLGREGEN
jgi:hypothetical protein